MIKIEVSLYHKNSMSFISSAGEFTFYIVLRISRKSLMIDLDLFNG